MKANRHFLIFCTLYIVLANFGHAISAATETKESSDSELWVHLKIGIEVKPETLKTLNEVTETRDHIIEKGDSIHKILKKYYGRASKKISALFFSKNYFENKDIIQPGEKVEIPSGPVWEKNYITRIPGGSTIAKEVVFFGGTYGKTTQAKFMDIPTNKYIKDPDLIKKGASITLPFASLTVSYRIKPQEKDRAYDIFKELKSDPAVRGSLIPSPQLIPHYQLTAQDATHDLIDDHSHLQNVTFDDHKTIKMISENLNRVTIAIIDSGVAIDAHKYPLWLNPGEADKDDSKDDDGNKYIDDIHGAETVDRTVDITDHSYLFSNPNTHWHGTHIAGILTGRLMPTKWLNLLDKKLRLMILRVTDSKGNVMPHAQSRAILYAQRKKASVINMSIAGAFDEVLADYIARYKDMVFVVAAGNYEKGGMDLSTEEVFPAMLSKNMNHVITVAALDLNGQSLAKFSNYGGDVVDIAAPGIRVRSTLGDKLGSFGTRSGTSQATPLVALTAALIRALGVKETTKIKERLIASADYMPELDGKVRFGSVLNLKKAVWINEDIVIKRNGEMITGKIESPTKLQLQTYETPIDLHNVVKVVFDFKEHGDEDMIIIAQSNDGNGHRLVSEITKLDFPEVKISGFDPLPVSKISEIIPATIPK